MKVALWVVLGTCAVLVACSGSTSASGDSHAVAAVAPALDGNKLAVRAADLRTKPNGRGQGTFVYHPTTRFSGVERYLVWLVIDKRAYALNGATKGVTPTLPWPREADDTTWGRTGLNKFSATEATDLVFTDRTN
jgi:hypothetical protein